MNKAIGSCIVVLLFSSLLFGQEVKLSVQTGHSASINTIQFSYAGNLLASASSDNSVIVWSVQSGKQLMVLSGHTGKVTNLVFHPSDSFLVSCSDDKTVKKWNLIEGRCIQTIQFPNQVKSVIYEKNGSTMLIGSTKIYEVYATGEYKELPIKVNKEIHTMQFSPDYSRLALGGKKEKITLVSFPSLTIQKSYSIKSNQVVFSNDSGTLLAAGLKGKLKKWKLNESFLATSTFTAERVWHSYTSVAISSNFFIGGNRNSLINVYATSNGKKIKVLNGHTDAVLALDINRDETLLASAGQDASILLWDTETWEIIKVLKGTGNKVNAIAFNKNDSHLVIGYQSGEFKHLELLPGGISITNKIRVSAIQRYFRKEVSIVSIESVSDTIIVLKAVKIKYPKKDRSIRKAQPLLVNWNIKTNSYSLKKLDKVTVLNNSQYSVCGKTVVIDTSNSFKAQLHPNFLNKIKTNHTDLVTGSIVNQNQTLVVSSSHDGLIKLWDKSTENLLLNLVAFKDQDHIYVTPDNYYYSTKGALELIGFRIGLKVLSFDQFDIKYNRPDIILQSLKTSDTVLYSVYKQAYTKRMKRNSIVSEGTVTEFVPTIEIIQGDFAATSKTHLSFKIRAHSQSASLEKLFIIINGVPLHGSKGIPLQDTLIEKDITIELSKGLNSVQYYVLNKAGIYSLKHTIEIFHKTKKSLPNLYLVCIGASNYATKEFNLTYAEKDASDIELFFKKSNKYSSVQSKLYTNSEISFSILAEIKAFLSSAGVDDIIMITYAGHGLLDAELNYYLSTYNVNFSNPSENGLAFSEFEKLLEDLKCRNKLMLIDACHSGEIDKEEMELSNQKSSIEGDLVFRNVGLGVARKTTARSSFELSKALFAESNNHHGAVIISSAGGGEYAIEGERWKNGIFTYCFINALKNKNADFNRDGTITVGEVQRYLSKEVPALTKGKQNPTSRVENITNNFKLW